MKLIRHYYHGGNKKSFPDDPVEYYTTESGMRISWRVNPFNYRKMYYIGNEDKYFKTLKEVKQELERRAAE